MNKTGHGFDFQDALGYLQQICEENYLESTLPNTDDFKIAEILESLMAGSTDDRCSFASRLTEHQCSVFFNFADRMSMVSVRRNSVDLLKKGITALTFAAIQIDWREILMTTSLVYHSALKLSDVPSKLFAEATRYAPTDETRGIVMGYCDRGSEHLNIEEMGLHEVGGPHGLIYQFDNYPIPEAYL